MTLSRKTRSQIDREYFAFLGRIGRIQKVSVTLYHHTSRERWEAILRSKELRGSNISFTEALGGRGRVPYGYTREPYVYLTDFPRIRKRAQLSEIAIKGPHAVITERGRSRPLGVVENLTERWVSRFRRRAREFQEFDVVLTGRDLAQVRYTLALAISPVFVGRVMVPFHVFRIPVTKILLPQHGFIDRKKRYAFFEIGIGQLVGLHPDRLTYSENWEELEDVDPPLAGMIAVFRDRAVKSLGVPLTTLALGLMLRAREMGQSLSSEAKAQFAWTDLALDRGSARMPIARILSDGKVRLFLGHLAPAQRAKLRLSIRSMVKRRVFGRCGYLELSLGREICTLREAEDLFRILVTENIKGG